MQIPDHAGALHECNSLEQCDKLLASIRILRAKYLAGPLANLGLARDGTWIVIATGQAWHAGTGYVWWCGRDNGNAHLIGVEAESVGTRDDWTGAQRVSYPRGVAALLAAFELPASRAIGHKEWAPARKIDPAFWDMTSFRADVARWMTTPAPASPPPPLPRKDDTMTPIDLRFYDHDGPDPGPQTPDGLYFRGSLPAELGANSRVISAAWVRWVAYWGSCTWRIVAWDAVKPIAEADPRFDWWALPPGVRGLTVEGRREHPGVQPAASLLVLTK